MNDTNEELDLEILQDFITESLDGLNILDEKFVRIEEDPTDKENISAIFRAIHSIKGNSGFFDLNSIKIVSHKMENLLDELREGRRLVTEDVITILLEGVDILRAMLNYLSDNPRSEELTEEQSNYVKSLESILAADNSSENIADRTVKNAYPLIQALKEEEHLKSNPIVLDLIATFEDYQRVINAEQTEVDVVQKEEVEQDLEDTPKETKSEKAPPNKSSANAKKTMRVDEETIDGFMRYIGELIIASEVFNHLQKKLENEKINPQISKEFKNAIISFNQLSNDLQTSLMEIRKVPLKGLFSKAPRLVRDLAKRLGKQVKIELLGETVSIDKSLLETLEDPFVHMIRNSLDHGLETTEGRKEAGKDIAGHLQIKGYCDSSFFYLEIKDDGRGIDPNKIRQSAISKGLVDHDQASAMSDQEAINMVFMPGFSSAEEVSEVSGRGVGMDVVLTNIKSSNGNIDVRSQVGQGTNIVIKLPLTVTLIVVAGLVIGMGSEQFIVPIENILEVAEAKDEQLYSINGQNEVVTFRDVTYPLIRLREIFNLSGHTETINGKILVLVKKDEQRLALLVDSLLGLQQVVLKNIGEEFKRVKTIAGGAIMGDGKVGLVIDIKGLVQQYGLKQVEKNRQALESGELESGKDESQVGLQ